MSNHPFLGVAYGGRRMLIPRSPDYDEAIDHIKGAIGDLAGVPVASISLEISMDGSNELFEVLPSVWHLLEPSTVVHVKAPLDKVPSRSSTSQSKAQLGSPVNRKIVLPVSEPDDVHVENEAGVVNVANEGGPEPDNKSRKSLKVQELEENTVLDENEEYEEVTEIEAFNDSDYEPIGIPRKRKASASSNLDTDDFPPRHWIHFSGKGLLMVRFSSAAYSHIALRVVTAPDTTVKDLKTFVESRPQLGRRLKRKFVYSHHHNGQPVVEQTVGQFEERPDGYKIDVRIIDFV